MNNKLILNCVYVFTMFSLAGSAAACYDGIDSLKSTTASDVVNSMQAGDCSYQNSGKALNVRTKAKFYLAEISDIGHYPTVSEGSTLKLSEYSAMEVTKSTDKKPGSQRSDKGHSKAIDNDAGNGDWMPAEWSNTY